MQKKQFGAKTFIYPMPVIIAGANVNGKPNFNTIAYCGVVQSNPAMISLSMDKKRYTNKGIKENNTFSINIPSERMVRITDYIGIYSGLNVDKSKLFKIFYGKLSTAPMIEECPINIECRLISVMDFGGKNDLFIGEVVETYSEDRYMTNDLPDIKKIKPIVFSRYDLNYWNIGKHLGEAETIGRDYLR